jgi:glycosyltransferase involved in cell wall biosynthesis
MMAAGSMLMWEHHAWDSPIRVGGRAFAERFLERGWRVAWLNGPLAPWNLAGGNDEVVRRRRVWREGGRRVRRDPGELFCYAPLSLVGYRPYPLLDREWFHRQSLRLTAPPLFPKLRAAGFEAVDLLWLATGSPFFPLLDRVRRHQCVYRLSDETGAFPDTPRSYRGLEEAMMRRVDGVIATAAVLAERARRFNRRVLLLPNGVDLARFAAPGAGSSRPAAGGDRRRAVYVGALDSWLDTARIELLARSFPQVDFVLAGPIRIPTGWARTRPNLQLCGPVPPDRVPGLLAGADVGLIPFLDSPLTRAIHPVKLYEYLAAGLPVVASDLEEIRRIGSPAHLAGSDAGWQEAFAAALQDRRREEFVAFAARHDWSRRFADLCAFLGYEGSADRRREAR